MFLKLRLIINKYLVQNLSYEILALNGKNAHFKVKFSYVSSILLDLKTCCSKVFINSCLLHNTSLRTQFSELSTLKLRSVESKWFQELLFPLSTLQTSCKKQIFNPAMLPEKLKLMSKRKIIISWLPIYLFYRTSCKLKVSSCSIDCRITLNLSLLKMYCCKWFLLIIL